jgi:hypothetical protein
LRYAHVIASDAHHHRRFFLLASGAAAIGWLTGCGRPRETTADSSGDAASLTAEPPHRLTLPESEPLVRVRIGRARRGRKTAAIGADRQWLAVIDVSANAPARILPAPIRPAIGANGWRLTDGTGLQTRLDGTGELRFETMVREETVPVGGVGYPGDMHLVPRTDVGPEAYDYVNHLPLETYLPGVLHRELFSHWRPATFAAQAIDARSYACMASAHTSVASMPPGRPTRSAPPRGWSSPTTAGSCPATTRAAAAAWPRAQAMRSVRTRSTRLPRWHLARARMPAATRRGTGGP